MPTFVVTHDQYALKVIANLGPTWVADARQANIYPSKYAAKRHLKQLDNIPDNIKIVELAPVGAE